MAYHPQRGRVVLFGGLLGGVIPFQDTWEWDGANWTQLAAAVSPAARMGHAMAYDAARERVVLFAGISGSILAGDTWVLGDTTRAEGRTYGVGCSGSAGTPRITGFGPPRLGHTRFAIDMLSARPHASFVLLLGTRSAQQLFDPCTLLVHPSPAVYVAATAGSTGFGSISLPLRKDPRLLGAVAYAQGLVLDAAGGFASLAFSNGLRLTLGE